MFAPDGTWMIRSYDKQQEDEAAWLAGCLLLPRPALVVIARRSKVNDAAARYEVSAQLLRYRMNATGVTRQMRASRR